MASNAIVDVSIALTDIDSAFHMLTSMFHSGDLLYIPVVSPSLSISSLNVRPFFASDMVQMASDAIVDLSIRFDDIDCPIFMLISPVHSGM
jgi:hypothetical protein